MGIKTCNSNSIVPVCASSEKPPHHMGIKTLFVNLKTNQDIPLKNLPTTWGLRLKSASINTSTAITLKNLPTTWGLRHAYYGS